MIFKEFNREQDITHARDTPEPMMYTVPLTPNIYKGMILDKIANVDVDLMNDTLDNIHIDCDLSEYEIDVINKAVDSEPDNYFKTKYLIPEVENPNYFLVGRTHPDTDMAMYTMLPMSQYHRLHMAESNKSPLIETNPKVKWFRMSSLSAHRLHSFNPSQDVVDITHGIDVMINKLFGK